MEWRQQYFLWNNRQNFQRGWGRNVQISEEGIALGRDGNPGIYYTRICDSRQQSMQWDRILLEGQVPYPQDMHITIYTCEEPYIFFRKQRYDLQELIKNDEISIEQKEFIMEDCKRKEFFYQRNQLLRGITGRYLWIRFEQEGMGKVNPCIWRIQVWFPQRSWSAFLPELYQKQGTSFLDCFLGIFQTMYEDMNRKIEEIPGLYCAGNAPSEWLVWLSQWLSVEEPYLWSEEQLRYLIRHAMELSGLRGTTEYMRRILWLYTGSAPYIVEYWQWAYEKMDSRRKNMLEELYGRDSFCAVVIIPEKALPKREDLAVLERLARHCSPAHMDVRIEILQTHIFLDKHSYLGINSYLEGWSETLLDGQKFLPFVVLKEKGKQYEG